MKENNLDFTPRETDVLILLAMGKSNKAIAETLYISDSTVKAHLTNIYKKLGVENRIEAVVYIKDSEFIPHQD
jgi:DNA-binding NarL/FixJ family response regulator